MDIFLSINNREQVLQLPIVPLEVKIATAMNNQKYETIALGEINQIGLAALSSLAIDSFFPARAYPFSRDTTYFGWEYVEIIEAWKTRRIPIRLVISDTPINMACTIDRFEYGIQDGSKDVYYTLELTEFKFVKVG